MGKKRSTRKGTADQVWENVDSPGTFCDCDELAQAIIDLSRQVHLLGRIIDDLVSEFQWQNNQLAENFRTASDFHEQAPHEPADRPGQPTCRTTLFE